MPPIHISYSANKRSIGAFPELLQTDVIAERTPTQLERPLALMARPGLKSFVTVGQGPVRGIYQKAGIFGGDAIIVSGTQVFRVATNGTVTTFTGAVAGRNRVKIDLGRDNNANDIGRIATRTGLYLISGTTVTEEDFPDNTRPGCADVLEHRSFWLAIVTGTDRIYYIVPGDSAWTALDFTDAQYQPDKLVALDALGEVIMLMGDTTVEGWALTGDSNNPIQPAGGIAYDVGCRARDSVSTIAGVMFWVDERCNVRMTTGGPPQVISDSALAEQIRAQPDDKLRAWSFGLDGHLYYVMFTGANTWVYDASAEIWSRFTSKGYAYWRAHLGTDVSGVVMATDALPGSNKVWLVDPYVTTDEGEEIACTFTGMLEVPEGRVSVSNLVLSCAMGFAPRSGQGSDQLMAMRYSDDETATWSPWQYASMGTTGRHKGEVRWNRLGQASPPRRIFQLRSTDPGTRRFSDLRANVV